MKKPTILLLEDNEAELFGYAEYLTKVAFDIRQSTTLKHAREMLNSIYFEAILLDLRLPDGNGLEFIREIKLFAPTTAIIVVTGIDNIATAVHATKMGADNYLTKPIRMADLKIILDKCIEIERLRRRDLVTQRLLGNESPIFGSSTVMKEVMEHANVAASNDTFILLQGETGTGKGVMARWIHNHSDRKSEVFVEVNCSSIKGDLLRSELFGHAKGSFTSAIADKTGLVEAAHNGTLFLDEICEMDKDVQSQLLTTLESQSFRRVGENHLRHSDFRLICATNADLFKATESGIFRKDLYYRICVFPIELPPLAKRQQDIITLAQYFLAHFSYSHFPLSSDVKKLLTKYSWPGNIRELRNMLERAMLLGKGSPLNYSHFPGLCNEKNQLTENDEFETLAEAERKYVLRTLNHCHGDKKLACKILGLSLSALYRRLDIKSTRLSSTFS
jgi:DNA-binding NtrC family response regulator